MFRCIELAEKGAGSVSPNPMVGCVIVRDNKIIGEGYHEKYGEAHAEVNAINSVQNRELLKDCTLYVSLEPCAHFGQTPPCSDLIIRKQIPKVVIGTIDPFAKVAGKGIEKLKSEGIEVTSDVLGNECRELNKRFFTFHQLKRPYIILKWAQTRDGFIDIERDEHKFGEPTWITGKKALEKVHQTRAVEDAILVGTNTALKDNPSLSVRHCQGRNPIRIVLDNKLRLPQSLHLFNGQEKTIVFNSIKQEENGKTIFLKVDFSDQLVSQITQKLHEQSILSVIIEGGRQVLESFIQSQTWDEAQIYSGNKYFGKGISAPKISGIEIHKEILDSDNLVIFKRE